MGATGVCPGTYMCSNEDATDTCEGRGFQVANKKTTWKTGDGLLMNQQSFHRGAAHVDPSGPHRVVFIITFSPRPKERGETRMLGQGGSYSLRWDMWGHTLNDLENAPTAMVQPWTTLRALGLYKPKDADWGWDYISQQSMRAATLGTGYEEVEDFQSMVTIPEILLPEFAKRMSYTDYFATCTQQWKDWAQMINIVALAAYLFVFAMIALIGSAFNSRFSSNVVKGIFWSTVRLLMLYSIAASVTYYVLNNRIPNTAWGRSILNGSLFHSPFTIKESLKSKIFTDRVPFVMDENDILITDRYNDKALNALVDTANYHQGNMELNSQIRGSVETFLFLNKSDQKEIARTVVDDTFSRASKFAFLNDNSIWVPLEAAEATEYVLNELNIQAHPLLQSLSREAAFLLSECRYGYKKSTVMSQRLGYVYVNEILNKISSNFDVSFYNMFSIEQNNSFGKDFLQSRKPRPSSNFRLFEVKSKMHQDSTSSAKLENGRYPLLSKNQTKSIAPILQVGDVVEGQYKRIHNEVGLECSRIS